MKMSSPENVEVHKASLDSLPIEVLLMICDRLDADTLVRCLMYINKRFYEIINDHYLWKKRVVSSFRDFDVAFMLMETYEEKTFNWKEFVWNIESEDKCWSDYETNTVSTVFKGAHFSEVDAVVLAKDSNHCISASRDRSICLWNTVGTITNPEVHKTDSHTGWIWDLGIYDENHFLSCSWDSNIKLWNMDNFSPDAEPVQNFTADSAVLSITSKQNFVAAGLYTPKVIAFDPRVCEKRLFELNPHKRSIIELCLIQDHYLTSLSEDRTLSVWDLRTHSAVVSTHLAKTPGSRFPMCASYYENILFVGDSRDYMYWLDCSRGMFNTIKTVKFVKPEGQKHHYKLNCIKCSNYGSIITGGNEGAVYIITPTNPPKIIARIVDSGSEITSIDYQNNTLVVGYVNSEVQMWKKK